MPHVRIYQAEVEGSDGHDEGGYSRENQAANDTVLWLL